MLDDFAFFFVIPFALLVDAPLAARGVAGCFSLVFALLAYLALSVDVYNDLFSADAVGGAPCCGKLGIATVYY